MARFKFRRACKVLHFERASANLSGGDRDTKFRKTKHLKLRWVVKIEIHTKRLKKMYYLLKATASDKPVSLLNPCHRSNETRLCCWYTELPFVWIPNALVLGTGQYHQSQHGLQGFLISQLCATIVDRPKYEYELLQWFNNLKISKRKVLYLRQGSTVESCTLLCRSPERTHSYAFLMHCDHLWKLLK